MKDTQIILVSIVVTYLGLMLFIGVTFVRLNAHIDQVCTQQEAK